MEDAPAQDRTDDVEVRPRRWWAIGLVVLGVLWALYSACLFATGYSATATVITSDDGFCAAVWQDESGQTARGEVECDDDRPGTRLDVRVTGWPDAGDPTQPSTYVGIALLFGLPPVAVGGGRLLYLAVVSRRARLPALPGTPPATPDGAGAALAAGPTAAAIRRSTRVARAVMAIGVVGTCAVIAVFFIETEADATLRENGVTTVGTVQHVDPDGAWSPGGALVRFTADGESRTSYVGLGGYADDYAGGETVTVVYDPGAPDRFIIDDALYAPGWTEWPLRVALVAALVGGLPGILLTRARGRARRLLATRAWRPVRVRIVQDDGCLVFTTEDAAIWRSVVKGRWPAADHDARDTSDRMWTGDAAHEVWWVSDGRFAVFSPDQGSPLILVRLRSEGPLQRLHRAHYEQTSGQPAHSN